MNAARRARQKARRRAAGGHTVRDHVPGERCTTCRTPAGASGGLAVYDEISRWRRPANVRWGEQTLEKLTTGMSPQQAVSLRDRLSNLRISFRPPAPGLHRRAHRAQGR